MDIALFPHNQRAYKAAVAMMNDVGKAAIVHPTGTGKSFIGFQLAAGRPFARVCWLSPSEYIFKTQIENLKAVTGGYAPENIWFCTYAKLMLMDTVAVAEIKPDCIILDEFHRCGATEWGKGVDRLLKACPHVPILGLSATSVRYLDNQRDMADELFDGNIASEMTLGEAIVRNILLPPVYVISVYSYQQELERYQKRLNRIRNRGVRDANQKYLDALRRALDKADGLETIFEKHLTDTHGKYIVFCANVEHLRDMVSRVPEWFSKVDAAPHIYTAYSDDPESDKDFSAFKQDASEHLKLLFCIDMLNEGVHVDDISGVILFRPTVSPIIYKQQIGRALSASKCKEPVILDIVNNFDNLYSIGAIEEEMSDAAVYFRRRGEDSLIVNEHFRIIDEVRDCRQLFSDLQNSLSATWDMNFAAAKAFFQKHGHLNVPKVYKTETGLSLGTWLLTQRRVRAGLTPGILTEAQIARLDVIGMQWDNQREARWEKSFAYARAYYEAHGDLNAVASYVTEDGFALGQWLTNMRQQRNGRHGDSPLTAERIERLNAIGMVWNKLDYIWERNYLAACRYFRDHGNLDVPHPFVCEDGFRLGAWLSALRGTRACEGKGRRLTDEQIRRLDDIGMVWGSKLDILWNTRYQEAEAYSLKNGNLNIPFYYVTASGAALGRWLYKQKQQRRNEALSAERIAKLDALQMDWGDGTDSWEKRYLLAKAYYKEHGDLRISQQYVTEDGIWLGKWLYEQRKSNVLTKQQKKKLESVGMDWRSPSDIAWDTMYDAVLTYRKEHGTHRIPKDVLSPNGKRLAVWLEAQRRYYMENNPRLTADRRKRLDAFTEDWGIAVSVKALWARNYAAAKAYYEAHGDLRVPLSYIDPNGIKLGEWLEKMRCRVNIKYALSRENVKKLNEIGMVWEKGESKREQLWNQYYDAATAYFEKNGDLNVPCNYITQDGLKLGYWVYCQRKAKLEPDKSKISIAEEKIAKLDAIGMLWMSKSDLVWEKFFKAAAEYRAKHGSLDMPKTYQTEDGLLLGRWLNEQRKLYDEQDCVKLSAERIRRLSEIGMIWTKARISEFPAQQGASNIYPQSKPTKTAVSQ